MFFGTVERPPRLSEFEFEIPDKLIAQHPPKTRDKCKLMVVNKETGDIEHKTFSDIHNYFNKGDVLVLNNTKVFPARLYATKDKSVAKVEVFLLRELENDLWEAMVKPARKVRIGNKLIFDKNISCDVIDNTVSGGRVLRFEYNVDSLYPFIDKKGHSPLPPYIKRESIPSDKNNYQTIYASERGSVAAPTAGLHFTKGLLNKIEKKGVKIVYITLHIGLGTFRPILVEDLTRHHMDSEYYEIPHETADTINQAKAKKKKVWTVGTSTNRALETVVVSGFQITPKRGWTDKFIYPPYKFKMCDRLITNFHQPKSTLMMLVSAFSSKDIILEAYQQAIKKKYKFYSYGDSMLLL
ncbi:MAG: tRNA preQ1(34) S-adenosylmethionine ribosyltransferase-isomerase QueA [Candidatus Marinimicrobia bacterium]|nr:tRNA preQ1(34) S-adenosylmethionine ribosyltransferase-isomerase QueA [Candidatus Neomarinimicrobiota bacterium]|tara:strand:+ start:108907 stop:109965 length:1059 start_codon:yes stop_codon:yes gene_type:complete